VPCNASVSQSCWYAWCAGVELLSRGPTHAHTPPHQEPTHTRAPLLIRANTCTHLLIRSQHTHAHLLIKSAHTHTPPYQEPPHAHTLPHQEPTHARLIIVSDHTHARASPLGATTYTHLLIGSHHILLDVQSQQLVAQSQAGEDDGIVQEVEDGSHVCHGGVPARGAS